MAAPRLLLRRPLLRIRLAASPSASAPGMWLIAATTSRARVQRVTAPLPKVHRMRHCPALVAHAVCMASLGLWLFRHHEPFLIYSSLPGAGVSVSVHSRIGACRVCRSVHPVCLQELSTANAPAAVARPAAQKRPRLAPSVVAPAVAPRKRTAVGAGPLATHGKKRKAVQARSVPADSSDDD